MIAQIIDGNALSKQLRLQLAQRASALRARGIFGGKDISGEGLGLGQAALYCVTEIHSAADIRKLAAAVQEVCA